MKKVAVILLLFLASCVPLARDALPTQTTQIYYVATSGNDSNSGAQSAPFRTIAKCLNKAASGYTCNVAAGTYTEGTIKFNSSGVSLQAVGKVLIKGAVLIYGDNNVVRGFILTDKQQKAGIRLYGDYNLVENNEIYDTLEDGIWFWGKGNTIRGNYIHNIHDDRGWPDYDNHVDCYMTMTWEAGNSAYSVAEDTVFENNLCAHDRARGSNQGAMIAGAIKNTTFRNNTFIFSDGLDGGYSPAFALYGGTGYTIENNYVCNTTGKGESVAWIEGAEGVKMTGNTYAGYNMLIRGIATTSNNTKTSLPCVIAGTQTVTPTIAPTPTRTATRTPQPTATPAPNVFIGDVGIYCPLPCTIKIIPTP